jgi:polyisoprenoid-binding protein YceI
MRLCLKSYFLSVFFLICFAVSARADADRYYVPPQQFNAAFQIMDSGFSNIFGLFREATGGFLFDSSEKTMSRVKIAINASSLMVANGDAGHDLALLIDPVGYSEISFAAAAPATFKDGKAEITGTLTAHGVSKPFSFEATLNNVGKSHNAGGFWESESQTIGLSLRGSLKRADFGMGDPPEEPGRFGDTIALMLEMQALKQ